MVATDAPLIPSQLKRLARRVSLGLGRDGSYSGNGSGDLFIAFSTANRGLPASEYSDVEPLTVPLTMLSNTHITDLFDAVVEATEVADTS